MCLSCVGEEWAECGPTQQQRIMFVVLEYSRDVTYQTDQAPTSQAALLTFLRTTGPKFHRLVVNSGMHDQGLIK